MDVVSSDGDKLGEVSEVFSDHVMVQKGFFFPKDYYIPVSAMDSADDDTVYLAVTKDEALNQESAWGQRPTRDTVAGTSYDTTAEDDLNVDPEPFVHEQDTQKTHINEADEISVPIHEEELVARKREVNRGEVEINKDVIAEEESVDVPVTEERVEVTRRDVDRDVT
ncbi:MAG TPA: DUF2382 domain-containing protein, partial [Mycobacteriales bacterium]|nr:DUF2382 domain-containing protein [Mycobacteriales bacterium]